MRRDDRSNEMSGRQHTAEDLAQLRRRARTLLDLSAPRDAMAVYYTLYHDPARTRLYVEERGSATVGFLAVCQTGRDLFRPVAVLRARDADTARGPRPRAPRLPALLRRHHAGAAAGGRGGADRRTGQHQPGR